MFLAVFCHWKKRAAAKNTVKFPRRVRNTAKGWDNSVMRKIMKIVAVSVPVLAVATLAFWEVALLTTLDATQIDDDLMLI